MLAKNNLSIISKRISSIKGIIIVPGDKSISHRALILSSISIGTTKISGLLESEDVLATLNALKKLGVKITKDKMNNYLVTGVSTFGYISPKKILNLGNSGTGVRLLIGTIAGQNVKAKFTGDKSLSSRPMKRITSPLMKIGAQIKFNKQSIKSKTLPLEVIGTNKPLPIQLETNIASAQVKSCLMLACINARGTIEITEPQVSRDHTEIMFRHFGISVKQKFYSNGKHKISFNGEKTLIAKDLLVPRDPSSASFIIVACLITKNSHITIPNVCLNPQRIGLIKILKKMGGKISIKNKGIEGNEQIGDIVVKSSKLNGVKVPKKYSASMIDEYPILCVAASIAKGKTKMLGIEELRFKESDRIKVMSDGLKLAGIKTHEESDSLEIEGKFNVKGGISINSENDHRIAMSFLILGMVTEEPIRVENCETIYSSFPNFFEIMRFSGANFTVNRSFKK